MRWIMPQRRDVGKGLLSGRAEKYGGSLDSEEARAYCPGIRVLQVVIDGGTWELLTTGEGSKIWAVARGHLQSCKTGQVTDLRSHERGHAIRTIARPPSGKLWAVSYG